MSWGNELWDQFENVSAYAQKGIDFCEKFSHFLKERCSIENEYAGKLKKLVKSYTPKKKDDDGFSTSRGFEAMLKELHDLAGQHESIAETLLSNVYKESVDSVQNMKQERKKLLQNAAKQESVLTSQVSQLDKSKKAYEKAFREAEKAQETYKKCDQDNNLSRADVEKMKQISSVRQQASEDSKKEYASEVEKTRITQTEHYLTNLPVILQQFQNMDEARLVKVREWMINFANTDKNTLPIMAKCIDGMVEAASILDSQKDSQMLIEKYKTGFSPSLDVPFEDLSNPVKNSNTASSLKLTVSGKPKKRVGLLGIFGGGQKGEEPKEDFSHLPPSQQKKQLATKIEVLRSKICKETANRDGMVKMQDVYNSNPNMGDASVLVKQLEENGQMLDQLRHELHKYETYLNEAGSRLQESGHTPNASPLGQRKDSNQQNTVNRDSNSRLSAHMTNTNKNNTLPSPLPKDETVEGFSDDEFVDGGMCVALYAYDGAGDGLLSMTAGQNFTVLDRDQGDGWTHVKAGDGSIGYVPTSYMKFD